MAQSILIFDFGTNEEAVQQARLKVEVWKQAFRLGDKISLKFEREEPAEKEATADELAAEPSGKAKSGGKKAAGKAAKPAAKPGKEDSKEPAARVRLFVRLAFSDHEKLSHQRWLDRIPTEEPFKSAKGETVRSGESAFAKMSETFESLD
jgi:hypothetical protein